MGFDLHGLIKFFNKLEDYVWRKDIIPVKASTLADFFWCSRRSYIKFILENTPASIAKSLDVNFDEITREDKESAKVGSLLHGGSYGFYVTVLPIPPKERVYKLAKDGRVIPRNLKTDVGMFQIQGAVDEIRPEDEGYIIRELKTTRKESISRYALAPAEFQVQIYGWILSGYLPVKRLELVFINQNTRKVIYKTIVIFDEKDVKNKIVEVLNMYRHKQLKPPKQWKCSKCSLRSLCEECLS